MHEMATLRAGRLDHTNAGSAPLLAWGVDGCPAGWFYFALDATGEYCYGVVEDLRAITDRAGRQDRVLVDIPIGLRDGPRCCDLLARRRLGLRRSSVFPAPVRAALQAEDYDDACRRNQEATGKKLSKQTFNILPKVRAVDDLLLQDKKACAIVQEVHPELCFWALNDEVPMATTKKTRAGFKERMAVLEGRWEGAEAAAREVCTRYCLRKEEVARDDIADAMVAALTARADALKSLPEQPPKDAVGLPMQMVYAAKDAIRIEKTKRRHKTVEEYQWEQAMAERSKFMVQAIRARQQGCPPEDAIDDGDPLLALLDQFAEPDLKPERYELLRDEVENQLSHEREWRDGSRGPRGPGGGLGR